MMDELMKKQQTNQAQQPQARQKSGSGSKKVFGGLAALLVVASIGAAGIFYRQAQDARGQTLGAQQQRNQEESDRVIGKLSQALLIDQEDKPTVARVDNADELRKANEDFYKNAQNGDFLVLYPQRAILFREADEQIVNVAPIINTANLQGEAQAAPSGTTPTEAPAQ